MSGEHPQQELSDWTRQEATSCVMAEAVGTTGCGDRMLEKGDERATYTSLSEAEAQRWVERAGGEPDEGAATLLPDGAATR